MEDLFKSLVWDFIVKRALALALATLPGWIGGGPIGAVLVFLALRFADSLYAVTRKTLNIELIVLKNEAHRHQFNLASAELKTIAHETGYNSKEYKDAREGHKTSLSQFVHFDV